MENGRRVVRDKNLVILVLLSCLLIVLTACSRGRPRDVLVESIPSPDGKHVMNVYESSGGATIDFSVTVAIKDVSMGSEWNVYFHYHKQHVLNAVWENNSIVFIDGIRLNIHNEYYESFAYHDAEE